LLGRLIRGVTMGGAVAGAVICFVLLWTAGLAGFAALFSVFALTWAATRIGYHRKQRLGTAEAKAGRDTLQVLANLGTAAVCAILFAALWTERRMLVAMAAALAEAAADTVSSEIGQAIGGIPRSITTWQKVAPGTNGGITVTGTLAGAAAGFLVAIVFAVIRGLGVRSAIISAAAAICGMIADSILGATIEHSEGLGNNGVNFISTVTAAAFALLVS